MTQKQIDFITTYYPFAKKVESETGVPALFTIAQTALETGYGDRAPGNMMFGVKDTDGVNGNEQLITTTEYHSSPNVKYPFLYWVKEVVKGKRWQYKVKDWFRKYPTPYESFRDHALFLQTNKRYGPAFSYRFLPYEFAKAICTAGYATSPDYWPVIESIMKTIEAFIRTTPL